MTALDGDERPISEALHVVEEVDHVTLQCEIDLIRAASRRRFGPELYLLCDCGRR